MAFCDGNADLQGFTFQGIRVISPIRLPMETFDYIVISARESEEEIADFLIGMELGDKIIRLYES